MKTNSTLTAKPFGRRFCPQPSLKINNPKATASCGCGTSFAL